MAQSENRGLFGPRAGGGQSSGLPNPSDLMAPPKPRPRPGREAEEFEPLSQAERDEIFQRGIERYRADPKVRERTHELYEKLLRLHSQKPKEWGV